MTNLSDLYEMAEKADVTIDCCKFLRVDSMSHMDDDGDCFIAIDPFRLVNEQDEKIKLTHELGHCILGAFYNIYSPLDIRDKHEVKVKRWSFKQHIPYDELLEAVSDGYAETWELAEYFDVPEDMVCSAVEYYKAGNR